VVSHPAIRLRRVYGLGLALLVAVSLILLGSIAALADQSRTTVTRIPLGNEDVTNLCNNETVVVRGTLVTTITVTPTSDGGYTVLSTNIAPDLLGESLLGNLTYKADQGEVNLQVIPPSTNPAHVYDAMWLRLVPQGSGPTLYLLSLFAVTIYPDETFTVNLQKTYTLCTTPR
jgi:hypothetical protein